MKESKTYEVEREEKRKSSLLRSGENVPTLLLIILIMTRIYSATFVLSSVHSLLVERPRES